MMYSVVRKRTASFALGGVEAYIGRFNFSLGLSYSVMLINAISF